MKQKIDANLLSVPVCWWQGDGTGWQGSGHGCAECLCDIDDDFITIVRPPTVTLSSTTTPGASPPYTPKSGRSPIPDSPSRSRPSSSGRSSQYSSGRMSPLCESPPPQPTNPPPPAPPPSRVPATCHATHTPVASVCPPSPPPHGESAYATLPLSREDRRKSMALTPIRKDRNTYVALPPTGVLQENVYSSLKPKKSMSFASLKQYRASKEVATNGCGSIQPLQYRARSHDELRYVTKVAASSGRRGTTDEGEDRHSPEDTLRSREYPDPKQEDTRTREERRNTVSGMNRSPPGDDSLCGPLPPPVASKILPRAKLRRRSIAVANEFSLGGLVRSVSGVSVRRSVRVEGSRYTATSADTPDAGLRSLLDSTGVVAGVQHAGRGSAPSSPQLAASRSAESTPSKFNIFSKFKGVKTSAKTTFKAEKVAKNGESTIDSSDGSLPLGRSHSHDNIQSPAYPTDRDALCSPLHYRSRGHQNQDETRRTENTLKIWIMEAKGIPNKKKYFCTIKVNSSLYGSTCSKQKSNMCFWGEYFELDLLPQDSTICIELMREPDKKSVNKKIGTVEIDLKASSPSRAALEEQWYPVKVDKQDRDVPALRIKHRFQSVDILPLPQYGPFRQYLKENATSLCQLLEPVVSVKAKEDIATTLVNIMQAEDRAIPFLVNLVFTDIQRMAENEHLLFRGNSVATKAIEAYMKLVGEQYLHDTLREPVQALITASEDLEVDPLRITNIQSLHSQRNALKERVSAIWEKILQSGRNFPVELRHVFHTLRERLSRQEKCELIDYLISSCVFLRFLCPAVLSPSLFNIIKEYPDERAGRNLTLVAKILQTLANFTHFQGKENFMEFLNDFIDKEQESCRTFLRTISSSLTEEDSTLEFDGKIDLGKHLALLHLHLADALAKLNTQGCESEASKVLALVDDVSTLLGRDYNETPIVSQPLSTHTLGCTPPLVSNPSLLTTPSHINNNYTREECVDGLVESPVSMGLVGGGGASLGIPSSTTLRSQSLPRAVTPVYSQHQLATGSPGANFSYRDKTAANDLSTNDEYVLITAFDHHTEPQNYMYPSVEANNNNTAPLTDVRLSNGNTYYMAEVAPPGSPLRQGGSPGPHHPEIVQQSHHGHLHIPHQSRLHPRTTTMSSRSHSVSGVPTPIERRGLYQDECSEFYSYMDSRSHQIHAICMDSENNIQGSQTSISQLSNIASSGYQSFAYSQSSSPVDSLLHTDNSSLLSRENGNPGPPGFRQVLHGSPLASPLHQPVASKHRAVAVHPAHLGHTGHVSLHGTPRHIPRVPQPKGSPNSSLSSSQSVEDLSSLRRGRTRQRRSASSSSDSSPDTRPASHTHAHSRRPHVHPPRTNPHCSPHLVPPSALRQEHRSRSRHDRSVSGRRGRNYRSCDREDFPRGTTHCYEDSEDDVSVVTRSSGGAGVGGWMKDGRHVNQDEYQLPHNVAPQQLLDQQEDQMRAIVERLMSMEQEFRHEQEVMRREMHDKDARIDAQAKKIAALDTANTHLIRTIASLSSRSGEMKSELPGDLNIDSCNASDTSDYKSSSC